MKVFHSEEESLIPMIPYHIWQLVHYLLSSDRQKSGPLSKLKLGSYLRFATTMFIHLYVLMPVCLEKTTHEDLPGNEWQEF